MCYERVTVLRFSFNLTGPSDEHDGLVPPGVEHGLVRGRGHGEDVRRHVLHSALLEHVNDLEEESIA